MSLPSYLANQHFYLFPRVLYYDEETVNKNEDTKRPLVSVIYKISGDGNQKGEKQCFFSASLISFQGIEYCLSCYITMQ